MKTKIKSKLLSILICFSMLSLSACGGNTPPAHEHTWSGEWSSDATNHWHVCEVCGAKKDEAAHEYDSDHDAICNVCGYERSLGDHVAESSWSHDSSHHWHACAHEGCELKFDYTEHTWSGEWSSDATSHWHVCEVCGAKKDEAAHEYDSDHDAICNVCGYERSLGDHVAESSWSHDSSHHWHACAHEGCEFKFDYAEHSFDDDHDTTCECGYVRDIGDHAPKSTWSHDDTHHWHACAHEGCKLKFDYNEYTADLHGFCDTCGEYLGQDKSMPYNWDYTYENQADFGTLAAGTYYYRMKFGIFSGSLEVISSNMSSESYAFYWKDNTTGEWKQSSDTCEFGPQKTSDTLVYLVITLPSQVTNAYITYYTNLSV